MNRAQWKTWRIKRMGEIDQQKFHSEVSLEKRKKLIDPPYMSGDLSNFHLADVLQILATKAGRHLIEVFFPEGMGKIYLEGELLHSAEVIGPEPKQGIEALRVLLSLPNGHFEVRTPALWPKKASLNGPVQALIIEAARLEDEANPAEETFFDESLFEEDFLPQKTIHPLQKIKKLLPEINFLVLVEPSGEAKDSLGDGAPEELAGTVSFISLQLKELGHLLGLGELKAFAASSKRHFCAALCGPQEVIAMKGQPRKGLLWWSKKLLQAEKEWRS